MDNTALMPQLRQLWASTGLFTKILMFTLTLVFGIQYGIFKGDINKIGSTFGTSISPVIHAHQYWRLITAEFTHGGFVHILFNLFALITFGIEVEKEYGTLFYATLHLMIMVLSQIMETC
jgi:rhomboid protease GluP